MTLKCVTVVGVLIGFGAGLLTAEEHVWLKGLKPEEAEALRKFYQERYNQ
jgi:hypothetical protein